MKAELKIFYPAQGGEPERLAECVDGGGTVWKLSADGRFTRQYRFTTPAPYPQQGYVFGECEDVPPDDVRVALEATIVGPAWWR